MFVDNSTRLGLGRNAGRGANGSTNLCEALALCQSIVSRYRRCGTEFSTAELKAIENLRTALPAESLDAAPNAYMDSFLGGSMQTSLSKSNGIQGQHGTTGNTLGSANPSNSPPSAQSLQMESGDMLQLVNFIERSNLIDKSLKEVTMAINEEMGKLLGALSVHTFSVVRNDRLLLDPINGVASPMNESTALGKSASMTMMYTIAGTLYIPLRTVEGEFVGCIEAPGGKALFEHQGLLAIYLRVISTLLANMEYASGLSAASQKAEAMLTMATRLARDTLDETVLVQSIMNTAKTLTESDRCSVFIVNPNGTLQAHFEDGNVVSIPAGTGIAGYVAQSGNVVNITNAYEDERFNREVDKATGYHTKTILCLPIMYEGQIVAVAQLLNKLDMITESGLHLPRTFGKRDEEVFRTFSMFAAASLRNCRINDNLAVEKKKSDAILDVVTLLSNTDIRDVDGIVRHVLHGAKKLLNADRSSLFLLDKERNELYSRMADSVSGNEIRFPSGQGIAGTVAASGVGENIVDAYKDSRFNSAVDRQLGYRTQSILCEPIILNGEVLAVVQLVNKVESDGHIVAFSDKDRATFKIFSLFAGISINNSHLLEFAVRAGREAMELNELRTGPRERSGSVVQRNPRLTRITEEDRVQVLNSDLDDSLLVTSTKFNLFDVREHSANPLDAAATVAYKLLLSTGLPQKFGCRDQTLLNFILQCRKKYRFVPYHNFFHVVDVCQTIHTFLYEGRTSELLTELECFVLLITTLVHDLDHMGVNNSFYLKTDSPLGILSSASGNNSVLEVHHCNLAIEILSDPDSDVFEGLSADDGRFAYSCLIDCVLATDMARHGEALKAFLDDIANNGDATSTAHHRMIMEMLMKAGDVSNVTKPFEMSRMWAMAVTEEFYRQGDMEKEKGVEVLPMFDRSKNNELAKGQIGFIDFVAGKFFKEIVTNCFTGMQWCLDNIEFNRAQWQATLDGRK